MIYFTYKVADETFELTQEEHEKILKLGGEGKSLVSLREGTLGINTAFIRWWKLDEESLRLHAQEEVRRLGAGDASDQAQKIQEKIRLTKRELSEKLNWERD